MARDRAEVHLKRGNRLCRIEKKRDVKMSQMHSRKLAIFGFRACLPVMLLFSLALLSPPITRADDAPASATAPANPNAATESDDLSPDAVGWPAYVAPAAKRMKILAGAMWAYAQANDGHLPHDIGSLVNNPDIEARGFAENCLTPGDERNLTIPNAPTADWINQNTSYVYLAADLDRNKIVNSANGSQAKVWGNTVMYHTQLDQPFTDSKRGGVIILTYIDGHSEVQPIGKAKRIIEASKKILATGK